MDQTLKDFRLMEPTLPDAAGLGMMSWVFALLILGAIVITLVFWGRRGHSAARALRYKEIAYRDAVATLTQLAPDAIRETAIQTSFILRQFLAKVTHDPALYETHEEFITRQDSLKSLRPETQAATKQLFDRLAAIKYAREIPDNQPAELIADSKGLLATLHKDLAG